MNHKRRRFIKMSGAAAAGGMLLPQWACQTTPANEDQNEEVASDTPVGEPSLAAFGIQLYTLRDIIGDDPKATLKSLADYGYKQIESYEGEQGIYWGMTNKDFKSYIDDLGLDMVSSHCAIYENFEEKAAQAAEIGLKYLICPYIGPQKSLDDFKKVADDFNSCGEVCRQNGIRFAYHNHGYSFEAMDGVYPQDLMMDNTDPALVDYEMDIYWVITGKADPIAYLEKYKDRWRLCHIKDRMKNAAPDESNASCDLGTGTIDFPSILKVAADMGMEYYIVEQERYDNSTPLDSAKAGAEYLSKLVFA